MSFLQVSSITKTLRTVAREFVGGIKSTIVRALPVKTTNFDTRLSEKGGTGRVVLKTSGPIGLPYDHHPSLYPAIKYRFTLSGTHSFLKVESSSFCVLPSKGDSPFFRYKYLDTPPDSAPSAYFHVCGHRGEIVKPLCVPERPGSNRTQSPSAREKGLIDPKKIEYLAELHFLLGRPCSHNSTDCRIKPIEREGRSVLFSFNR